MLYNNEDGLKDHIEGIQNGTALTTAGIVPELSL
jgi:hypothetical protein